MSENQLTMVKDPGADEAVVVDRFVQASREIVPGVQVSLAKRVICPGSNRVLCLAAHTSVPMNDNEIASVSDLALKLSDGTNVRLSLSFFNDAVGGPFQVPFAQPNFTRSFYDPERYRAYSEGSGDSKLGAVLFAMSVIAVASLTMAVFGPLSNYVHINSVPDRKKPAATMPAKQPIAPVVSATTKDVAVTHDLTGKHEYISTHGSSQPKVRHHRSSSAVIAHGGSPISEPKEMMLVPPPPPFTPSSVMFTQSPIAPVQIPASHTKMDQSVPAQVKTSKTATALTAKKDAVAQTALPVKALKQPAHASADAPPDPAAVKPHTHRDFGRSLQDQMMMPMYAYARATEAPIQAQARQSERAQAANHTVDNSSFAGNVDPAMHLAPLPGGDDATDK